MADGAGPAEGVFVLGVNVHATESTIQPAGDLHVAVLACMAEGMVVPVVYIYTVTVAVQPLSDASPNIRSFNVAISLRCSSNKKTRH